MNRSSNGQHRPWSSGVVYGWLVLGRLVVFLGHLQKLILDRLPFACGLAGDLAEDLAAKVTLVPTFGPPEPVEESVEFCLAQAGPRSIPATLGSVFLGVIPIRASFGIHRKLYQTQNHHQVANHFGLVQRSAKGSKLDSILTAGQVGQVQQVVAIRFVGS